VDFQYGWYMGPKAKSAVRRGAPSKKSEFDEVLRTATSSTLLQNRGPEEVAMRAFVPNIVPQRRQTNPFCAASSNATGWREVKPLKRLLKECKPRTHHQISGTDDSIPEMPKFR